MLVQLEHIGDRVAGRVLVEGHPGDAQPGQVGGRGGAGQHGPVVAGGGRHLEGGVVADDRLAAGEPERRADGERPRRQVHHAVDRVVQQRLDLGGGVGRGRGRGRDLGLSRRRQAQQQGSGCQPGQPCQDASLQAYPAGRLCIANRG